MDADSALHAPSIIALSLIQGLTEFLPISSSMHLVLWDRWLWPHPASFDVAVHCGSLVAVMLYFRREVTALLVGTLHAAQARRTPQSIMLGLLVLASLPVVIVGYFLRHWGWENLHDPAIIGTASLGFAVLLWWADRYRRGQRQSADWTILAALTMGLAQIFALVPGASRSGVCMTAALMLGFSRTGAARLALLMSIPVIAAAGVLEGWHLWQADEPDLNTPLLWALSASFATSFVASLVSIPIMLWLLSRVGFVPFVLYRCVFGVYLLYIAMA